MVARGEIDLNKDFFTTSLSLYTLFNYIRKCDMIDAEVCYRWADFIADQCKTIDYTSVLAKYIDSGAIHPYILAVLLKHGADINAKDENDKQTFYEMIALAREMDRDFLNEDADDITAQILYAETDCSYKLATHAAQGSVKAIDNLLKESYEKVKALNMEQN